MKNLLILFCSLILSGVFGADEIIVLVKKGDSVTLLNYDAELQRGDKLLWTFNGDSNFIAKLDREENMTSVDGNDDWRFKDRLMLEILTGSLTINSITITNSGLYKLQIMATTVKHKSFRVTVSDTVKTFSVMLGDPVTLYTDTELQTGDTIEWKFGGNTIAYLAGPVDSRFTNSDVSHRTGDLNITDIRSDQSGQYEVKINSRSFILQRILHVNVRVIPEPVQSIDWMKIALWVAVLVLVIALVSVIMYYKRCCRRGLNKKEENETCERLNQQSFNTNGT